MTRLSARRLVLATAVVLALMLAAQAALAGPPQKAGVGYRFSASAGGSWTFVSGGGEYPDSYSKAFTPKVVPAGTYQVVAAVQVSGPSVSVTDVACNLLVSSSGSTISGIGTGRTGPIAASAYGYTVVAGFAEVPAGGAIGGTCFSPVGPLSAGVSMAATLVSVSGFTSIP